MTRSITLEQLRKADACSEKRRLFRAIFGARWRVKLAAQLAGRK